MFAPYASYITPSMTIYSKKGWYEGRMALILDAITYSLFPVPCVLVRAARGVLVSLAACVLAF